MKQLWTWLALDRLDFMLLSGLGMLWYGLSLLSVAAAWAACGGVVILFCLIGALRLKRGD